MAISIDYEVMNKMSSSIYFHFHYYIYSLGAYDLQFNNHKKISFNHVFAYLINTD